MNNLLKAFTIFFYGLFIIKAHAQLSPANYFTKMAGYNLSGLWQSDKLKMEGTDAIINFPEPLGFISDNYHRFYIHYTGILKDSKSPYIYHITGKTRVNNNVCAFTGTITVIKAILLKKEPNIKYRQGQLTANIDFKESPTQIETGEFKGTLTTNWYIGDDNKLHYDSINCVSDSFNNNQFTGTWTDYKTHQSKKCNWGDFRIPASGDLDNGAGEFSIDKKYVNNGWQNYSNLNNPDKVIAKKAAVEEMRQWWK